MGTEFTSGYTEPSTPSRRPKPPGGGLVPAWVQPGPKRSISATVKPGYRGLSWATNPAVARLPGRSVPGGVPDDGGLGEHHRQNHRGQHVPP